MTETYATALQTIISEFKSISPEITNAFIFKKDGEILAINEITTEDLTKNLISALNSVTQQAETIGGIENLTIQGADSQLNITTMNNLYLATVSSRTADQKIVKTLTQVIVPTVVKLVDQIAPDILRNELPQSKPEGKQNEETEQNEPIPESPVPFSSQQFLAESPINQFMVEKIRGLLVPADTVRIDRDVISKWNDLDGGKEITMVHIETLECKKTTCKFKPIKEAKCNGKGIIQIPEKILQTLQTSKGKLVMVKPVIE